jgi:chemotaxis protein methyltransferase CheR
MTFGVPQHFTDEEFLDFQELIHSRLGVKMPEGKRGMLQSRLTKRIRELRMDNLSEYHQWIFSGERIREEELEQLFNMATTNKTDFYRESAHFDFLLDRIIPEWRHSAAHGSFRLWSAGCSSGEEPYTFSMALSEAQAGGRFAYEILATDISTRVLGDAKEAIYPVEHSRTLPPAWRSRYLLRSKDPKEGTVRIAPEIRQKVRFGRLNFLSAGFRLPFRLHLISFRNVMIYFDARTQEAVIRRMCDWLEPGGYLFVGHAESLHGLDVPLVPVRAATYKLQENYRSKVAK